MVDDYFVSLRKQVVSYSPELKRLKLFWIINTFLLVALFVMPQYFGIHIGYDITCTRFANILIVVYWTLNYRVFNSFIKTVLACGGVCFTLIIYLLVAFYTMIFRADINALLLPSLEIITFFMLTYAIRYVIGVRTSIKIINGCAWFLSIYGIVEFVAGHSLYLQFLKTVPSAVSNCYRSGFYRIMGPCGHPLGYGLFLIVLIAVACIDVDRDEVNFIKNPVLLFLLYANVFLTGSRSSLGIALGEGLVIILLSEKKNRIKTFYCLILFLLALTAFLIIGYKTRIGRYILMQITMLIDQVFDTSLAVNFGASQSTLNNSEAYRKYLPKIFTLEWLNPILGRGVKRGFGGEVITESGGIIYIHSVDNYYICQYIKYAYPGLVAYSLFVVSATIKMLHSIIHYKSGTMKMICVGFVAYFINLWWMDALQTLKFVYAILAVFFAILIAYRDTERLMDR